MSPRACRHIGAALMAVASGGCLAFLLAQSFVVVGVLYCLTGTVVVATRDCAIHRLNGRVGLHRRVDPERLRALEIEVGLIPQLKPKPPPKPADAARSARPQCRTYFLPPPLTAYEHMSERPPLSAELQRVGLGGMSAEMAELAGILRHMGMNPSEIRYHLKARRDDPDLLRREIAMGLGVGPGEVDLAAQMLMRDDLRDLADPLVVRYGDGHTVELPPI